MLRNNNSLTCHEKKKIYTYVCVYESADHFLIKALITQNIPILPYESSMASHSEQGSPLLR